MIRVPIEVDDGGVIRPLKEWEDDEDLVLLPEEFVLRDLPGFDLNDRDTVCSIVDTYGGLPGRFRVPGRPDLDLPDTASNGVDWQHVARHLQAARALTGHWLADREEIDVVRPWRHESFKVSAELEAWQLFHVLMNEGLTAFAPRIEIEFETPPSTDWPDHGPGLLRRQPPDLFAAMCLQLHQLMVEGLDVRVCQFPKCGKRFVRHQGRSVTGDQRHKVGVMYCSDRCSRNNQEQKRRDRRRQQQQEAGREDRT